MKQLFLLLIIFQLSISTVAAQVQVQNLQTESRKDPVGIEATQPRFSWQLASAQRNVMQTAYELKLTDSKANKDIWSTGKVITDQSVYIPYQGPALLSGKLYSWQVRVWDNKGNVSAWSTPASFRMGFLQPTDWKASWIVPGYREDSLHASPLFRKTFSLEKKIRSAIAYITAHGLYEAQLNGQRIGNAYFTPGFTSYNKRLQYQAYDVTRLIKQGNNAVGIMLGDGWYRGPFSITEKNIFGKDIALLFQLNIEYTDGTSESIFSDDGWQFSTGAVRQAGIYAGETADARMEKSGWSMPGYRDTGWVSAKKADFTRQTLLATRNEPVTKHETFLPQKIFTTPKGERVMDFGQNLAGWVKIKVQGHTGDTITISHAEVLDKAGNFYTDNLRSAKAQDRYILRGDGEEIFEPHFTWHGFRYIRVEGCSNELKPENFTAIALYSDVQQAGSFTCSNPLVNQLQHNIEWSLRGNFLDIPTDCPQRDERLGWTGDAQVFFRTAAFQRNVHNFFAKWMQDVAADQRSNGSVPHVIPSTLKGNNSSAGWGDVACIIPWEMYEVYGDTQVLSAQYTSMKAWVDFIGSQSTGYLWNKGQHFGDWLFYSVADDTRGRSAITDMNLIAQCYYVYSTQLLINAANVLGNTADVIQYTALLQNIKDAFVKEYITPNGALLSNTQTAYVLALQFDVLPPALRPQAAERLVKNIGQYKNHLTTGFLGTPYLCHVLSRFGYTDAAYKLLLQETYPSWLYPVKKGATTIWERWDGIKPDSTFQTVAMNSFNHYAYGAIGDWLYRAIAGLDTDEGGCGYKKIRIKPHIGGGFTQAAANYTTPYGILSSHWKIDNGNMLLEVEIPANSTAAIYLPQAKGVAVTESSSALALSKDIRVIGNEGDCMVLAAGSGKYQFRYACKQ